MTNDFIMGKQAAALLGKTPTTVYKYARKLGVGRKIGPVWLFTLGEVERMCACIQPRMGRPRISQPERNPAESEQ